MFPNNIIRSSTQQTQPALSTTVENHEQTPAPVARASQTAAPDMRNPARSGSSLLRFIANRLQCIRPPVTSEPPTLHCALKAWVDQSQGANDRHDRVSVAQQIEQTGAELVDGTIKIAGDLDLTNRLSLTSLPDNLYIGGRLGISECSALNTLPDNLKVGGDLYLCDTSYFTRLPDNLQVGGGLFLSRCTSLTSLPDNLQVGGGLFLSHCTSLTSLPDNLRVGGNLDLEGCTSLTSLPNWFTTLGQRPDGGLRQVNLTGTGLSQDVLDQLGETDTPGIQFFIGYMPSAYTEYDSLSDALQSWSIDTATLNTNQWQLTNTQNSQLTDFISRLHNTAEAQNPNTRDSLKQRIQDLVTQLQDADFRELALTHIDDALSSCDDRVLIVMDNIEISIKLDLAEQGTLADVTDFGKRMFTLEQVDKQAQKHIDGQKLIDPIEAILALRIHLSNEFQLPLSTRSMLFENCANLTPAIIKQAKTEVRKALADTNKVNSFLNNWPPFQKAQRRETAAGVDWNSLQLFQLNGNSQQHECALSALPFEEMQHPVALTIGTNKPDHNDLNIFELGALLRDWVERGNHYLTHQPISADDLMTQLYKVESSITEGSF